jgi:hypothetical protein
MRLVVALVVWWSVRDHLTISLNSLHNNLSLSCHSAIYTSWAHLQLPAVHCPSSLPSRCLKLPGYWNFEKLLLPSPSQSFSGYWTFVWYPIEREDQSRDQAYLAVV